MRLPPIRSAVLALALACLAIAAPARAQLTLTGAGGYATSGGTCVAGPTVCASYQGHFEDTTDRSTSYVKTSAALGTASSDRVIVLGIGAGSSAAATIGTPTCDAVSLTKAVSSPATTAQMEIWYGSIPSGTTCDITVPVASGTLQRMAFDWWTITGTTQASYSTRSAATAESLSGLSKTTATFSVPAGGVAIAMARSSVIATAFTCNSGTCNTRRGNQVGAESEYDYAGDSGVAGNNQTWTISVGSSNFIAVAAITWGP
jgi:hypothetical protein